MQNSKASHLQATHKVLRYLKASMVLSGNLIYWKSDKQITVSRSSAEVEFRDMANGIAEIIWVCSILSDLQIPFEKCIKLLCDEKSPISMPHDTPSHQKTKYININRHFIKEQLDSKMLCVPYISSRDQLADILTKGLPAKNFACLIDNLGVRNIHSSA